MGIKIGLEIGKTFHGVRRHIKLTTKKFDRNLYKHLEMPN